MTFFLVEFQRVGSAKICSDKTCYNRIFQANNVYHLYNFGKTLENTF